MLSKVDLEFNFMNKENNQFFENGSEIFDLFVSDFCPGPSARCFRTGRLQWLRLRVRSDRHWEDAHHGRHPRPRGHHTSRI